MTESSIEFLEGMLKIYSPSMREGEIACFLKDEMANQLGFSNVRLDKANNVYGEIGSGNIRLLLCGHMDTVPGKQPVKVTDSVIYGRGASDAKAALSSMILAASMIDRKNLDGKILVVGVTDEEGEGRGIREFIKSGIKVEHAIFGEPSGIDNITIGYKGRIALKIKCETASVHASAPWMSENAVERIMEIWKSIKKYSNSKEDKNKRYNSLSSCLTLINGGSSHNVTPGNSEMTVDIRIPPSLTCDKVLEDLNGIVDEFRADISFPKIQMKIIDKTEPFETNKESSLIRSLSRAIFKLRRKNPILLRKTGTGDMNVLGNALGIPVVTYGPGNPHMAHTKKEYVEVPEYRLSIEIYKEAIDTLFKL